ncbi:hypothetical protein DAEQUDRAFT_766932 [Daedalea quercina L-15889]|uniref:Uncharacterized protein n=1 Tax=Daedalea quercina L-15889 TaxID=1314783 RepID=A0A165P564_9APHY|nr:hypothetical protein DAEQUDRAFT_766932 [Daedalea quercina L-15889]
MADNPEVSQLIPVNLATACFECYLYGIFSVLYGTSTYLLVRQGREKMAAEGLRSRINSVYRAPMFIAAQIIFLTVTGHWVLTVYRLFAAFVNFRGGTDPLYYYADIALTSEVAKCALLVATVLVSDAMIIYRLYIIWGYNKLIILPPILTWLGLIAVGAGVCWQFSIYKLGDSVYDGDTGRWITADCIFTLATNIYCTVCISYRVFRTRLRARRHPSLAQPNLLSALAILVESAALHTAWNALFLVAFRRATPFQFTAIDLWSPVAGIAFMLINLRVALGWAQRAHPSASSFGAAALGTTGELGKRFSYAAPSPLDPPYTAHPVPRSPKSTRLSYRSEWDQTRVPERVSYGDAQAWMDQPWVVHAQPHPYASAAAVEAADACPDVRGRGISAPVRVPLAMHVTRVVDRAVEEKSSWVVGEAV